MSSTKTILVAAMLCTTFTPPADAQENLSQTFATCAGRFSAEREHAWLVGPSQAAPFEKMRQTFLSLIEASAPQAARPEALHQRILSKHAHAHLLSQATFQADPSRAQMARRIAAAHLATCRSYLLGG
ncbi:MAG: hypothetical protein HKN30_11580 [Sulfitobacter sp.]|nr:hypothetical protein [Sulfitobacter sp.]